MMNRIHWVRSLLGFACLVSLSSSGYSVVRRTVADSAADALLTARYLALADQFPQVAWMQFNPVTSKPSCILIGDKWILTAGHNYPGATYAAPVNFVVPGPRAGTYDKKTYTTVAWYRHPGYPGINNLEKGFDFAVAKLDRRVLNVAPAQLLQQSIVPGAPPNGYVGWGYIVGTGDQGTGLTGGVGPQGNRMAGVNTLEYYYPNYFSQNMTGWPNSFASDFDSGTTADNNLSILQSTPAQWDLECQVAGGDSGGGVFVTINGVNKLVATVSGVGKLGATNPTYKQLTSYGAYSLYSILSAQYQGVPAYTWILNQLTEPGQVSGTITYKDYVGPAEGPIDQATGNPQSPIFASPEFTIELRDPGTTIVRYSVKLQADVTNRFSFSSTWRGKFDIAVKGGTWLRKVIRNVNILDSGVSNLNFVLDNGDVDGDNTVSIFDYARLSDTFDRSVGDPKFDAAADLDKDGAVTVFDYSICTTNFDLSGDE